MIGAHASCVRVTGTLPVVADLRSGF